MRFHMIFLGAVAGGLLASLGCTKLLGIDKDYVETSTGTGTGTGTGGTSTSSTSASTGVGGSGTQSMIPCVDPSDCPGKENECAHRTCEGGLCGVGFTPVGTEVAQQHTGDCKRIVCDGQGSLAEQDDDADTPGDSNPCTLDTCSAGVSGHAPAAVGMSCGGALTCDGNGNCTGCTGPGDCPGQDTDCQVRSCTPSGVCGFIYTLSGTAVAEQTPHDCKKSVCNGSGQVSVIADSMDLEDDGNPCTLDTCSNGTPAHNNTAAGAPCSTGGGTVCDGNGACAECLVADTCPGQNNECQTRTCSGGKCGASFAMSGTPVSLQTAGDCKKSVCNGSGGITGTPDDVDVQDDGNPCTSDSCSGGNPVHAPVAQGTSCGSPYTCNGSGACVGCLSASDCPGQDNACQSRTCVSGLCGVTYAGAGTLAGTQSKGDCKKSACNGAGTIVTMIDDSDPSSDSNPCTSDVCSNGTAYYPPAAAGTACATGVCNGAGACGVCVPGDFKFCCAGNTSFCCNIEPKASSSSSSSEASYADDAPDLACCCEGTQDCDSSGHWSGCYQ